MVSPVAKSQRQIEQVGSNSASTLSPTEPNWKEGSHRAESSVQRDLTMHLGSKLDGKRRRPSLAASSQILSNKSNTRSKDKVPIINLPAALLLVPLAANPVWSVCSPSSFHEGEMAYQDKPALYTAQSR
eukprot:gnl/TRDRNA2_/TRDRNA2_170683_c0_seq2.p2 gnl/TRDRNA2_/TRDRNA2_170683_c0~~gnl/TRDRNA2_/TRDRNA2_170683_c0_seq2.p2  ORF type:complete len:129 (+),score=21.90 gnl/TRDRNA2_/TRDRNA2_170683_c0_seq2:492-878(+)